MIRNSTEGCFEGSKWQSVITGSRNGLMWNRWHAITWMDYVKIGHNNTLSELRDGFQSSLCVSKLEFVVYIEPQRLQFYSLSGWMSYRKISWSLEAARLGLRLFQSLKIWQAPRQQCCRDARLILERYDHPNIQSRGFETSRDLVIRRLTA